jgi:hypothetical protein
VLRATLSALPMNTKFKSSRPSNRMYVLKQFVLGLIALSIWPVYKIIFSNGTVSNSYLYFAAATLIVTLVREAFRARVIEIEFNSDNQQIIFYFRYLFSRTRQRTLQFKFAKLEIETQTTRRDPNLTIYFLSNKVEFFRVDKDGFSNETLRNIRDLLTSWLYQFQNIRVRTTCTFIINQHVVCN